MCCNTDWNNKLKRYESKVSSILLLLYFCVRKKYHNTFFFSNIHVQAKLTHVYQSFGLTLLCNTVFLFCSNIFNDNIFWHFSTTMPIDFLWNTTVCWTNKYNNALIWTTEQYKCKSALNNENKNITPPHLPKNSTRKKHSICNKWSLLIQSLLK